LGEALYLDDAATEALAKTVQEEHSVHSAKEGIIREFLEREVPEDWEKRSLNDRKLYWSGSFSAESVRTKPRDRVCALEIWCEALGGDIRFFKRQDAAEINGILTHLEGWKRCKSNIRFGSAYGAQKGFIRE
jgi:hypothetical protein